MPRQSAVAAVARLALTGSEVDDLAREIVNLVTSTLDVELAEVLEYLQEDSWARLAGKGWHKPNIVVFDSRLGFKNPYASASTIEADDAAHSAAFLQDEQLRENNVHGALIVRVPGRSGSTVWADWWLYLFSSSILAAGLDFLMALADILGMAVERKRLEAELRVRASS